MLWLGETYGSLAHVWRPEAELAEPPKGLAVDAGIQLGLDEAAAEDDIEAVKAAAEFADGDPFAPQNGNGSGLGRNGAEGDGKTNGKAPKKKINLLEQAKVPAPVGAAASQPPRATPGQADPMASALGDLMAGAPSEADAAQLEELHLKIEHPESS